ncbi:hypothetical protein LC087_12440 [Bacillus carboniphilus]|uniref:Phage protein n=1 Tax=Bacillus carboniphilus TaxID=86663 RepID=A0ABY9JTD2_9BACI|nr:hypothetical protein [Bacillus carboniphilus]WLR41672.1 hypothetical protein LC087_12440 [Bacillus carboniphilus]
MDKTIIKTNQNAFFLRYPINAHCEAEEMLGFPITQLNEKNTGMTEFRTLVFVGLKYGGNPVSINEAGEIMGDVINEHGMEYFTKQIQEAITKGFNHQKHQQAKKEISKKKN